MYDDKNNRLDSWNDKKKQINGKININHKKDGSVKFRIQPWSLWWFEVGENIGSETSCHFSKEKLTTIRPCIVISSNNFNHATYNKKVIVMPLTSKKEKTKIKHFHYELKSEVYKSFFDKQKRIKYLGLEKDSLVICNEIKTIDTKRLESLIYPELKAEDIQKIKEFIKKYLGI